jgi:phosphopantothenate synthetase
VGVSRVAMLKVAATEQAVLRGGTELALDDFARAVALVLPDMSPVAVEVETIDADIPRGPFHMARDARRFYASLFADGDADDNLLPAAIAALDPSIFSFRQVQTTETWRTTNVVVTPLESGDRAYFTRRPDEE